MTLRYLTIPLFVLAALGLLFVPVFSIVAGFGYSESFLIITLLLDMFESGVLNEISVVAMVMMLVVVAGAALNFSLRKGPTAAASVMGGIGLLLLLYFFTASSDDFGFIRPGPGFYLGLALLIAVLILNIIYLQTMKQAPAYGYQGPPVWQGRSEPDYGPPPAVSYPYPPVQPVAPPHPLEQGERTFSGAAYRPVLVGISGQYAGRRIDLKDTLVTIGRDPRLAHLVCDSRNEEISRKHCTIHYEEGSGSFVLEDYSTNGTFVDPNIRLAHGRPVYLKHGERFYLVDRRDLFEVRLE